MSLLLLDTHVLLWATITPKRLPPRLRDRIDDPTTALAFSVVSIWEVVIKAVLRRADFTVDAMAVLESLRDADDREYTVTADHALMVGTLPLLHRDPFDRLLLAPAMVEGATLITADQALSRYAGPVELIDPV